LKLHSPSFSAIATLQLYLDEDFLARWKQADQTLLLDAQMKKIPRFVVRRDPSE
jgi:hypothetical protein